MDEDLLTFLLILVEKDRILFLKEKLAELKKIDLENRGTVIAKIRTVVPLKEYQKAALVEKLKAKYKKKIEIEETIDPDILGGILIRIDDDLIDGSIRSSLEELKQSMFSKIEVN